MKCGGVIISERYDTVAPREGERGLKSAGHELLDSLCFGDLLCTAGGGADSRRLYAQALIYTGLARFLFCGPAMALLCEPVSQEKIRLIRPPPTKAPFIHD